MLDYGCGTGDTTAFLRECPGSQSVVGLDVSTRSLERARITQEHDAGFLRLRNTRRTVRSTSIYCNGVFHHIPVVKRADAVGYIGRCLRPGGVFALWENNPWNPGTQYVMHKCEFDRDVVKIAPGEAGRLLRDGGLEVLRTDHRFFFPHALRVMRPLEAFLAKVPLGGQYQVLARKLQRESSVAGYRAS